MTDDTSNNDTEYYRVLRSPLQMTWNEVDVDNRGDSPAPVSAVGGQPFWLGEPVWPLSQRMRREHGLDVPMVFIGQFAIPGSSPRLAYLFAAGTAYEGGGFSSDIFVDEEDFGASGMSQADDGDNALIIQPDGCTPSLFPTAPLSEGPSISGQAQYISLQPRTEEPESPHTSFLYGEPEWVQGDQELEWVIESNPSRSWSFLFQLAAFDRNIPPYGVAYGFIDEAAGEGRVFWQCD